MRRYLWFILFVFFGLFCPSGVFAIVDDCTISENYYCSGGRRCNYCTGGCTTCSGYCSSGSCKKYYYCKCGSADGGTYKSKPTSSLCDRGDASSISVGGSDWGWSCTPDSSCSHSVSCSANKKACSSVGGQCIAYGWNCTGTYGGIVQNYPYNCTGVDVCCKPNVQAIVCETNSECDACEKCDTSGMPWSSECVPYSEDGGDGSCGGSNGDNLCSKPTSGLCSSSYGSSSVDVSEDEYAWTCYGQSAGSCRTAGTNRSCSATRLEHIDSACGTATTQVFNGTAPVTSLCLEGNSLTWVDQVGSDGFYNWTCAGQCNTGIGCSAVNDVPPKFGSIVVQNETGTIVDVDTSGRNQICQTGFNQSKIARFVVTATDINSVSDVGDAILRFVSTTDSNKYTTTGVGTTNGTGVITFNVDTSGIPADTYNVYVQINDADSTAGNSGWIDTGRDFRIWDCLVSVSGKFYDGSGQTISCSSGSGYTNLIPSAATFSMAYYFGTGAPRNMVVTSPNFTSGDKLYWNTSAPYQPFFVDSPGANPTEMRVNGSTCVGSVSLSPKDYVDPYVDNPSMTVDYSSVLDQDAWFSVVDGSVLSVGKVNNYVPVTCSTDNCKTSVNGVVWSKGKSTLSSYDKGLGKSSGQLSETSLELKDTSYTYFYRNYFSKLGIGNTVSGSKNWSDISSLTGVILINGDLNINQNIPSGGLRMIVASGNINIANTVSSVNAVLMGKSITASGDSNDQLVIKGSLYASSGVTLSRSFTKKSDNNDTPAVEVIYDPSVMFKMPKEVARAVTQWRMN